MKKVLIILSAFVLCGCSSRLNENDINGIDNDILYVFENSNTHANVSAQGFKYYKPRDFSILDDTGFNHVLIHESNKYYLTVDINAYHNKSESTYEKNYEAYLSSIFYYDNKKGYLEIIDGNNSYFYIKMMYNYSYIEVSVKEYSIKDAVIDCAIILSSIKYNDNVIDTLIVSGDLDFRETPYEIKKPKQTNNRNILDVYEYDNYSE